MGAEGGGEVAGEPSSAAFMSVMVLFQRLKFGKSARQWREQDDLGCPISKCRGVCRLSSMPDYCPPPPRRWAMLPSVGSQGKHSRYIEKERRARVNGGFSENGRVRFPT